MDNFYGGPKGQDFSIKKIFNTKAELDADINKGWSSNITVSDYVIISYGLPNDPNYDTYKDQDLAAYGKTYNSTLWQKSYNEKVVDGGNAAGLYYKLISSLTGNTPKITIIGVDTTAFDSNKYPEVIADNTNVDNPKIKFYLPQAQVLANPEVEVLDCNQEPNINFNGNNFELDSSATFTLGRAYYEKKEDTYNLVSLSETTYKQNTYYYKPNVNSPIITFYLPQAQEIIEALSEDLKADQSPSVALIKDNGYSVNKPALKFSLPKSQIIGKGDFQILDADAEPTFEINSSDIDFPKIDIGIPQSQVMQSPEVSYIGPSENPKVVLKDYEDKVNKPILQFSLPKASQFYYGELLGTKEPEEQQLDNPEFVSYEIGDYYINIPTGFIYKITAKEGTNCTFKYQACFQTPIPSIEVKKIEPYDNNELATPTIEQEVDNNNGWKLIFGLPTAVKYNSDSSDFTFIGADEEGLVSSEIVDNESIKLSFKIPRGSKLFAGTEISDTTTSTSIEGAKPGDFYLNASSGYIYKLNSLNTWEKQDGSLKGPVGNALNIVKSYTIKETEILKDSLQNGVDYIESNYIGDITSEDIFAITWVEYETNQETSYWYYKAEDQNWGRVQLTGGITNLIDNSYNDESDGEVANKTYSIHYINTLIGDSVSDKNKQTYSASKIEELLSWGSFSDLIP